MDEKDYIVARDLGTLNMIKAGLRDIVAESNPHIKTDDYKLVYQIVTLWETNSYKALTGKDPDNE